MTTADSVQPTAAPKPRRRRVLRTLSTVLIVAGMLVLAWTFVVWQWNDPFTSLYTRWQQHKLTHEYATLAERYRAHRVPHRASSADAARIIATDARTFRLE